MKFSLSIPKLNEIPDTKKWFASHISGYWVGDLHWQSLFNEENYQKQPYLFNKIFKTKQFFLNVFVTVMAI
jgi:hypothetical protein